MLTLLLTSTLAAAGPQDLFDLQIADLRSMVAHPKDRGLSLLMGMLPERLERELEGEGAPPQAAQVIADLILCGKQLTLGESSTGDAPFAASLRLAGASAEVREQREQFIQAGLRETGLELATVNGWRQIPDMPFPVQFAHDGNDLVAQVSTLGETSALEPPAFMEGLEPLLSMRMDSAALFDMIFAMAAMNGEAVPFTGSQLVLGMGTVEFMAGANGTEAAYWARTQGAAKVMADAGVFPEGGLTKEILGRIPSDATVAFATRMNWEALLRMTATQLQGLSPEVPQGDPFELVLAFTGFDLKGELLDHLGDSMGGYLSMSTGGGSLASGVLFMEVRDGGAVEALVLDGLELLEELSEGELDLEVEVVDHGGFTSHSVRFPGLPVPVEPTWIIEDGWLTLGLSPQAAVAAVRQARSGGAGILGHGGFREAAARLSADDSVQSMSFMDVPALLPHGYSWMNLGMAAVGNALGGDEEGRPVPTLMPTYPELIEGARPLLVVARAEGDDLVETGTMDPSWTVNLTAGVGLLDQTGLLSLLPMVFASARTTEFDFTDPPLLSAQPVEVRVEDGVRPTSRQMAADLNTIADALQTYRVLNGRYPADLGALVTPDASGGQLLDRLPTDPWSREYRYSAAEDGTTFELFSLGRDGVLGGNEEDGDFYWGGTGSSSPRGDHVHSHDDH